VAGGGIDEANVTNETSDTGENATNQGTDSRPNVMIKSAGDRPNLTNEAKLPHDGGSGEDLGLTGGTKERDGHRIETQRKIEVPRPRPP
jgi:hypothetical protein